MSRNSFQLHQIRRENIRQKKARQRHERLQRLADSGIDTWDEYRDYESRYDRDFDDRGLD